MKFISYIVMVFLSINIFAIDRFALVIGNSSYNVDPLDNTINDAYDVSNSFTSLGYNVTTVINGNRQVMENAVTNVSNLLTKDSMVVFYYAGHAAQIEKGNYLIPVEEDIKNGNDLKYKSVNLDWVLGSFKSSLSRTNIIILDSCRDNPFRDVTRGGGSRGLSVISSPASTGTEIKNSAIIYATTDGNTAEDGDGRNSPFTSAFLKNINRENETILDVMTYVTQDVFTSSKGRQEPTMTNALKEKVYFFEPVVKNNVSEIITSNFGLRISSDITGELYINNNFVTNVFKGEIKDLMDIDPGTYNLEFITEEYSEIITVDVTSDTILPILFKNQSPNPIETESLEDLTTRLSELNLEKDYLEITKNNLTYEVSSLENQLDLHIRDRDSRDSRKKKSINSGFFSFISYVGAGIAVYYSYENYQNYNNATTHIEALESEELASNFLIGAAGATLFGAINSLISNYNSKKVIEYDLQEDIFLTQLNSKNKELEKLNNDYDEVVLEILLLPKR